MKRLLPLLVVLASAAPLLAQEPPLPGPDLPRPTSTSLLDAVLHAGPIVIPLFILSVFSLMLVIVYFLTIRRGAIVSTGYMATADALLRKRDYLGLLAVSNRHGEAVARVVQKMLEFTTKNPALTSSRSAKSRKRKARGSHQTSTIRSRTSRTSACSRRSSGCSAPSLA
jgi:biopolymer transport protein ExbB